MCKTVEVYLYRASVKVFGGCTTSVKKDLTSQCQMLSTVLCTFLLPLSLLMDILSVLFRLTAEPSTSVIFLAGSLLVADDPLSSAQCEAAGYKQ